MKKIQRTELKPGMRFSAPVFFDDSEHIFLSAGMVLSMHELELLQRWNISFVMTEGSVLPRRADDGKARRSGEEILDFYKQTIQKENPFFLSKTGRQVKLVLCENTLYETYLAAIKEVEKLFSIIRQRDTLPVRSFDEVLESIHEMVDADPPLCMSFILLPAKAAMPLAQAAVHSGILATIIARWLQLSKTEIIDIGLAALLHDVGMLRIPKQILDKTQALTDHERKIITAHVKIGYTCAVNELVYTRKIGKSIEAHHERWDGKGYPYGQRDISIDIGGRIIAVIDAFVAMLQPKLYRHAVSGYKALKNLVADQCRRFDPDIIRAFIKSVGIYPIGSVVLLNTGAIALISNVCEKTPARPPVRILIDKNGNTCNDFEENCHSVSLASLADTFIVKVIDPRAYAEGAV